MTVSLELTDNEAELVKDVLTWWEDGLTEAHDDTVEDPTLNNPEQMLQLVEGYNDQRRTIASVRTKLTD